MESILKEKEYKNKNKEKSIKSQRSNANAGHKITKVNQNMPKRGLALQKFLAKSKLHQMNDNIQ